MKIVLPGAAIGLFGGGENSRMFALAAYRMGYRIHVYSPGGDSAGSLAEVSIDAPWDDLDRVRDFASAVDVVTVAEANVPAITLEAAARCCLVRPGAPVFQAIENGIGTKRDSTAAVIADFSIIAARDANGACVFYPPIAIDRADGLFDVARSPAPIPPRVARRAIGLTRDMLEDLDLTGIACVDFTLTPELELVIHEVTPHPHPAGFLTVDACVTDQFEQHLRAVCGLPLGSAALLRPAAMATLRETTSQESEPDFAAACAFPQVKLHWYGSRGGWLTATAVSATMARQIVRAARASLCTK